MRSVIFMTFFAILSQESQQNLMWKVITSSNLNPSLKLFFYLPILTNNNLLLKIYCENIVIRFLNCHFLFFILFFLYFIHTFFYFPFLFLSFFSTTHVYPLLYLSSFFFSYFFFFFSLIPESLSLFLSPTLSLSFISLERKARLGIVNTIVNVCNCGERREKELFFIELYDFFK